MLRFAFEAIQVYSRPNLFLLDATSTFTCHEIIVMILCTTAKNMLNFGTTEGIFAVFLRFEFFWNILSVNVSLNVLTACEC